MPFQDREKQQMSRMRRYVQKLVLSKAFEYLIVAGIMANTIVLALHWFY